MQRRSFYIVKMTKFPQIKILYNKTGYFAFRLFLTLGSDTSPGPFQMQNKMIETLGAKIGENFGKSNRPAPPSIKVELQLLMQRKAFRSAQPMLTSYMSPLISSISQLSTPSSASWSLVTSLSFPSRVLLKRARKRKLRHSQSWASTQKMQLARPLAQLLRQLLTQNHYIKHLLVHPKSRVVVPLVCASAQLWALS